MGLGQARMRAVVERCKCRRVTVGTMGHGKECRHVNMGVCVWCVCVCGVSACVVRGVGAHTCEGVHMCACVRL